MPPLRFTGLLQSHREVREKSGKLKVVRKRQGNGEDSRIREISSFEIRSRFSISGFKSYSVMFHTRVLIKLS